MRKQRIRLTESQLNRVIKESVKRVLKESYYGDFEKDYEWDVNSDEWKKMFDDAEEDSWKYFPEYLSPKEEDLLTQKEIQDYEAMPEKQRHPNWNGRTRDSGIDKLAAKKPNNVLDKMNGGPVGSLNHFKHWNKKENKSTFDEFLHLPMTVKKMTLGRYAYVFKLNKEKVLNDILGYIDPLYSYGNDPDYVNFDDYID